MKFKKLIAACMVSLAAFGLAACGNKSNNASNKTITFWYGGDASTDVKPMAEDFTKKTGIKVQIQSIPWSQYNDKLLTAAASKSGPDALVVGTTQVANFSQSKALMDISNSVKNDSNVSPNKFFEGSSNTTKVNGKYYALPWYAETRALYYRKDLLKSVGYDHAPKTWDELYDAAYKLSKRGKGMYGFSVDSGEPTYGFMFARQNGATLIKNNKCQFNSPEMVGALTYLDKFVKNGVSPKQNPTMTIGQTFGNKGPIPMFISGPWMMQSIKKEAGLKDSQWGVAELPKGKVNNLSNMGGGDLAVFNYSKHKSEALKFIKFMTSRKEELKYYHSNSSMPARKAAWDDKALSDENIQVFHRQLAASQPMPAVKSWEAIANNYPKAWEKIALNNANIQKTMNQFNAQSQKLLDK
jgi:multiple sugar transport system substrate-binding protein